MDTTPSTITVRLDGDRVAWKPLRVFDDGAKVYIEMPPAPAGSDLPPLFLIGADDKAELVNYRVQGNFLIVDRLLDRAELRLGDKGHQKVVRIRRFGGQTSRERQPIKAIPPRPCACAPSPSRSCACHARS